MHSHQPSRLLSLGIGVFLAGCSAADAGSFSTSADITFNRQQGILGGTVDKGDNAVVGILINGADGMSLCSGALIAPNLVLTAHHCVATPPDNTMCGNGFTGQIAPSGLAITTSYNAAGIVFNGSGEMPAIDQSTWFGVSKVSIPGNDICGYDMALLTLSSSITSVAPLLPRVDSVLSDGEGYTAIGFGITSPNGQTAGTRYKVTGMQVFCATDCASNGSGYDSSVMNSQREWDGTSATGKHVGTCEGDSGGPAIDSKGRVVGTVSRGPSNCLDTIYESVYGNAAWIKNVAASAATAGGYAAPTWVTGGGGGTGGSDGGGGSAGSGGGSTASCTHSDCSAGSKLKSGCNACVTKICAQDSYCCNTKWDATCVQEVGTLCGQTCN